MKVCVVGLGYIGLPTATLAAAVGHDVVGVDVNPDVVSSLNAGMPHIKEPGLSELLRDVVGQGRLRACRECVTADVFIVAVPTPITDRKTADLSYVECAARSVAPFLRSDSLFVIESTIPPGCTQRDIVPILELCGLRAGVDFHVAHCPERVIPGRVLHELVQNDRVIGGVNRESALAAKRFYSTFVEGDMLLTGLTEAELTKLAENAYRDVNIAFANELALVSEKLGVDVWEVIQMANRHPRVSVLSPGPGVGGHCIAVDPWFLVEACPNETGLMATARAVNDTRPEHVAAHIIEETHGHGIDRPVVACLGLTYKANVDDLRGSPSLTVISKLVEAGCEVRVCDPYVNGQNPYRCLSVDQAVQGADALVLLVDHKEFVELDLARARSQMRNDIIIDTRGAWRRECRESPRPVCDDVIDATPAGSTYREPARFV